jgi:hypothetical protein
MNKECTQAEGQTITAHEVLPQPAAWKARVGGGADGTTSVVSKSRDEKKSRQDIEVRDLEKSQGHRGKSGQRSIRGCI